MSAPDPRLHRRFPVRVTVEIGAGGRLETTETEDLSAGGCRVTVLFPLRRGDLVRIRLRSPHLAAEPNGAATVAWASREPPYRAGLQFSAPLAEQLPPFLRALIGPVPLLTRDS